MKSVPRVRMAADERRQMLLRVATQQIAQNGYRQFSIAQLAKACSITRAGVLHYFESKEHLLRDVLAARDAIDSAAVAEGLDSSHINVREALDRNMSRNINQREIVRLYAVLSAEAIDPDHPAHSYFYDRLRTNVAAMGSALEGFDRPGHEVAMEIYSFMDGIQANWLRDPQIDLWQQWSQFADRLFAQQQVSAASH